MFVFYLWLDRSNVVGCWLLIAKSILTQILARLFKIAALVLKNRWECNLSSFNVFGVNLNKSSRQNCTVSSKEISMPFHFDKDINEKKTKLCKWKSNFLHLDGNSNEISELFKWKRKFFYKKNLPLHTIDKLMDLGKLLYMHKSFFSLIVSGNKRVLVKCKKSLSI